MKKLMLLAVCLAACGGFKTYEGEDVVSADVAADAVVIQADVVPADVVPVPADVVPADVEQNSGCGTAGALCCPISPGRPGGCDTALQCYTTQVDGGASENICTCGGLWQRCCAGMLCNGSFRCDTTRTTAGSCH